MKTNGKFPLFMLCVLVCGCPKQPPAADPPSQRKEAVETEEPSPDAELERECFDGDPAACDQLGH
jgi:hypothetical protein